MINIKPQLNIKDLSTSFAQSVQVREHCLRSDLRFATLKFAGEG